ncbi:unnamed protein product [Prorocentrum cordatum]|nr:unnamed protein product [Polarella glacialis]
MARIAAVLPVLALGAAQHREAWCGNDTGGRCRVFACHPWRRGAECDGDTARCLCPQGACSSEEGICVPQEAACSADTGGRCRLLGCDDWRRGARCNTTAGHKCLCPRGTCSSMDGSCVGGETKGVASQSRVFTGHICSKFFSMTMISCPSEDEVGPTECVAGKCICKEGLYYVCHERRDNSTWSGCSKECKCQQQRPVDGCTPIAALASARADSLQI